MTTHPSAIGQPTLPDSTKTERLIVLVDPQMKTDLFAAAATAGLSVGEYVRRSILAAMTPARYIEGLPVESSADFPARPMAIVEDDRPGHQPGGFTGRA